MKEIFLATTIGSLLVLGLVIALRSGNAELTTKRGLRLFAGNVSLLILRIVGYIAGLLVIHRVIGSPTLPGW
jgi:hypothetical protein